MRNSIIKTGLTLSVILMCSSLSNAQTVTTQDVSDQLQASLVSTAPTVVYFGFDKDLIGDDAKVILDQQANWLMLNTNAKVNLAGHADAVGSDDYNVDLAMRRARAVESYLVSLGVNPAQMQSVVSRGESELAVATQLKEKLNRRVTTGVTGLVEIVTAMPVVMAVPAPPPPPLPPKRSYADSGNLCETDAISSLTLMTDMKALKSELNERLELAASIYNSESAINSSSNRYNMAAFTKAQCGIAIGYSRKGYLDKRSVSNCGCFTDSFSRSGLL